MSYAYMSYITVLYMTITIHGTSRIFAFLQAGVTAITEILGGLTAPFAVEFVELPKREFTKAVDLWRLGDEFFSMSESMVKRWP